MKFTTITRISKFVIGCALFASLSACGTVRSDTTVKNPEHVFQACKGDLTRKAATFDEANSRANISHRKGNKAQACKHRRKALAAMNSSAKSFKSGKCSKFHDVATAYISLKVKNFQSRIERERKATAALVKRDCS